MPAHSQQILVVASLLLASCFHPVPEPVGTPPAAESEAPKDAVREGEVLCRPLHGSPTAPLDVSPEVLAELGRVYTAPGDLPHIELEYKGATYHLPLRHTDVQARVTGHIAEVELTQTFVNPLEELIEVSYLFPLPENSAVHEMKMTIGRRTIEAEVRQREDARNEYEKAKAEGRTAALLEQERPNIFTQKVANIAPRSRIDVTISYIQHLTYDSGEYELVFPMVVGPRYIPGQAIRGGAEGDGTKPNTDEVPDASRISPPVVGGGTRSGHDISLSVTVDAGLPIQQFEVPTHEVSSTRRGQVLDVVLAEAESLPNRDFVLRWRVAGTETSATLLSHRDDDRSGGYFSLIVQPPELPLDELVGRREVVFVVDVSGSMSGVPLRLVKAAMGRLLGQLRPMDTFNVYTFAGASARLWPAARPANFTNLASAAQFVSGLRAAGGTEMRDAVQDALSPDVASGRHRYVLFLTDGYVGNVGPIFKDCSRLVANMKDHGQRGRVFGIGIGSSPNHELLSGLAKAGAGIELTIHNGSTLDAELDKLLRAIDRGVLTDVSIDWGGLPVGDVSPAAPPDLFATRPLVLTGRFTEPGNGTITIRGTSSSGASVSLPVAVVFDDSKRPALEPLWARERISAVERLRWDDKISLDELETQVTKLGLDHHLVTEFTSLVAVDRTRRVGDGKLIEVVQPLDTPAGVNPVLVGATTVGGKVIITESSIQILEKIYFPLREAKVQKRSMPILDAVADVLKENPTIELSIEGHTDSTEPVKLMLGKKRAEAVRAYLIAKGVEPERLTIKDWDAERPISDNRTKEGRERNRRVEFVITKR